MRQKILLFISLVLLVFGSLQAISAQTPDVGIRPNLAGGEVSSLGENKILLQTKDGTIEVALSEKTEYKRVPPDNPSIKAAVASSLTDIGIGDKLLVTGAVSADKKTMPAKAIYLMTKSDIVQKQTKDSEQWRTRGITGKVVSVNSQANQINIEVRGIAGSSNVILTAKENAKFRRYAPDSVKFSEAQTSSIGEVQTGDMIRALGEKSADGANFAAEEVVTGAFQTVAGTVKTVNPEKGEVVITDVQTKKDVTIAVGSATTLKKFPEEMAQRMAMMQAGGVRPGGQSAMRSPQGITAPQTESPQGEKTGDAPRRGGFGGGRGQGGGIDEMLDRFPNITVADLKAGEMIAVSSTKTTSAERITAIKLLAGVEPFLKTAPTAAGNTGQGRGGQGAGFTIPGLDGISFP